MTNVHDHVPSKDRALIEAARGGCVHSFELLVAQYHTRILNYLLCQTQDQELAVDLAQQTFFDAFRALDDLPVDRPFCAWLYRIARNNMLSECRRKRIRQDVSMQWLLAQTGTEPVSLQSTDTTTICHERDLIRQVLDGISPVLREALLLQSLCGFTSEEVAHILNISPATARQRICRAKEQFRSRYDALNQEQYLETRACG